MLGGMLSGGGEVSSTAKDVTIVWGKRASKIEVAGVASWTACATAAATLLAWRHGATWHRLAPWLLTTHA